MDYKVEVLFDEEGHGHIVLAPVEKEKERKRGFERVSHYQDAKLPVRKTAKSAGYDFLLPNDVIVPALGSVIIPTGIKAYMQDDEVLKIYIRSSLGVKKRLKLMNGTGIIDADYYNNPDNEGHIMIAIENPTGYDVYFKAGDAIAQGVFEHYLVADEDDATAERVGGIGSTGK